MKKIALALTIALSSTSVFADTYFRVGGAHTVSDINIKRDISLYESEEASIKGTQSLSGAEFATDSLMLGVGADFNNYIAGEMRYSISGNSKIEVAGNLENDSGYTAIKDKIAGFDGDYGEISNIEIDEQNRLEALLLFKTGKLYGMQPYILGGYSYSNLKAGGADLSASGFTYGAGLNIHFTDSWSMSLEYQAFPEISDRTSERFDLSDDEGNTGTNTGDSTEGGTDSGTGNEIPDAFLDMVDFIEYESERISLSFLYRF